jgi:hypothetical protein
VAPEVNALNEFNNAYLSKQLTQSSRLIPIAQCRDIKDAQQHYITFREGDPAWIEHSTKTVHHQSFSGDELESIYRKSLEKSRAVRRDFFEEIYEGARKSAQEILRKEKTRPRTEIIPLLAVDTREQSDRQLLISASEVLSAVFGLTLVLVGEPR